MKVNVELLTRVKEQILAHPESTDLSEWRRVSDCGTVMCIAGWACQEAGGEWLTSDRHESHYKHSLLKPKKGERDFQTYIIGGKEVKGVLAKDRGRRVLGLTKKQAERLFWLSDEDINGLEAVDLIDELLAASNAA